MIGKYILITDEQEEFIKSQTQRFNLSKFVRAKLDDYKKEKEMLKDLI